jgi:hypothetical protein
MATELIKRTIDGDEYEFEQFGAKQSLRVLMRLSKLVGKPLMLSMGAIKQEEGKKKFDANALGEAAKVLFDGMDENGTIELIEMLTAEKVLCNGKKIKFDEHYEKKLSHLFNVLATALDVQYGNFIEELTGSLDLKKEAVSTPDQAT